MLVLVNSMKYKTIKNYESLGSTQTRYIKFNKISQKTCTMKNRFWTVLGLITLCNHIWVHSIFKKVVLDFMKYRVFHEVLLALSELPSINKDKGRKNICSKTLRFPAIAKR